MSKGDGTPRERSTVPDKARVSSASQPITALWIEALGADIAIPAAPSSTIGSSEDRDVVIRHPSVSRMHAHAERHGYDVSIVDAGSRNGLGSPDRGGRVTTAVLRPGSRVRIGGVWALALTDPMRDARRQLAFFLGYHDAQTELAIMNAAVAGSFIVIGEPSCGRREVVRQLIACSPRIAAEKVEITEPVPASEIDDRAAQAEHGVAYIAHDAIEQMPPKLRTTLLDALMQPSREVMILHACRRYDEASARYGDRATRMQQLRIPTVATRIAAGELPRMLDHLFESLSVGIRTRDLDTNQRRTPNLSGLVAHSWPDNHDELRDCARYIAARKAGASQQQTAEMLGEGWDRSRVRRAAERWGLSL